MDNNRKRAAGPPAADQIEDIADELYRRRLVTLAHLYVAHRTGRATPDQARLAQRVWPARPSAGGRR